MTQVPGEGSSRGAIVVVDDDPDVAQLLRELLCKRGYEVTATSSAVEALAHVAAHATDVVLTDIAMPGVSGIELCAMLRERHPELLPIVITGRGDFDVAIAAIRAGAYDFITKPVRVDAVDVAVTRALAHLALEREVTRLRTASAPPAIAGIAGGAAIREMLEMIRRVADTSTNVLITGESGTGKELVARALHDLSSRREHPFVAVNCAAMPAALLESELFGHVRGAFTDAKHDRKGLFVRAGEGTILLDEIGEMPVEMQVKLLRVLQEHTVRPVGGDEEIPFSARVLASTNRDLELEVAEKRFREDLFYRINVVEIEVPPLRERGGDVLLLAQHFIGDLARRTGKAVRGLSAPAARLLLDYAWPGNVRELENSMERAVALCRFDEVMIDDLPAKVRKHASAAIVETDETEAALVSLDEMERRYIRRVLGAVAGNKSKAARILGIDRRSVYRRMSGEPPNPDA